MSSEIDFSDFGVTELKNIEVGDHFLWGGILYQKTAPYWVPGDTLHDDLDMKNSFDVQTAKFAFFYGEELVIPVSLKMKVSSRAGGQ